MEYHSTDFDYGEHLLQIAARLTGLPDPEPEPEPEPEPGPEQPLGDKDFSEPWEAFFKSNAGESYKQRRYVFLEFGDQFRQLKASSTSPISVLEVGAGEGATLRPLSQALLREGIDHQMTATDISKTAVERLKERSEVHTAFVWDFSSLAPAPALLSQYNVIMCIFCLGAIHPEKQLYALENLRRALKPGGVILLRDHAYGDDTLFKHKRVGENLFQRKDGTLAYYFTQQNLTNLTEESDLIVVEHQVCCVKNRNRKTTATRERCFIHAVLVPK